MASAPSLFFGWGIKLSMFFFKILNILTDQEQDMGIGGAAVIFCDAAQLYPGIVFYADRKTFYVAHKITLRTYDALIINEIRVNMLKIDTNYI